MRTLKFILEMTKPYRWHLWGMIFAVCMVSIDANIKPYLIKRLIDTATSINPTNFWYLVGIFAVSQLVLMLSWTFSDFCAVKFSSDFRTHTASILAQRVGRHSYSFFQNNLSGGIVAKISDAFNLIPTIIFTTTHQFLNNIFTVIISLCLLAGVHIMFSIGLFLWVLIFLGGILIGLKKASPITKAYAQARSTAFGYLSDLLTNMLNVKLFATSSYEMNRFHKASIDYVKKSQRQGYFLMNLYAIQGSIFSIYAIGFLIFLVHLHSQELITAGDFALVFMINFKIVDRMFELSQNLRDFIPNWGAVDEALRLLENAPEILDSPNATNLKVTQGQIVFDKVEFHYTGAEPLFEDTSVTIAPGQKVGLVGYSGGGKSTFVNLILRLYDVSDGRILIEGLNIKDVTQDSLRSCIGMIPQDPSLFHRSLMDNIRYGKIDASDEEVIQASKPANAHNFITKFPLGYESLVGDRGVKLSGGQRQRVAIARAFLKNAPILILDEATSQLDSVTENIIQDSLWELMQGKTTIVIAHRLSTLLHMDRILVFDDGKIVEDGSHLELLSQNTMYKALWDAQVGGFLPDTKEEIL
jgi:ATP-binding cassette subfamily B protein